MYLWMLGTPILNFIIRLYACAVSKDDSSPPRPANMLRFPLCGYETIRFQTRQRDVEPLGDAKLFLHYRKTNKKKSVGRNDWYSHSKKRLGDDVGRMTDVLWWKEVVKEVRWLTSGWLEVKSASGQCGPGWVGFPPCGPCMIAAI